jgi:hypothetical protein
MAFCGERMDDASEATYTDLRAALKKFINENSQLEAHKIGPSYDSEVAEVWRRERPEICKEEKYRKGKELLQAILAKESATQTRKRLESPGDPRKGDCL